VIRTTCEVDASCPLSSLPTHIVVMRVSILISNTITKSHGGFLGTSREQTWAATISFSKIALEARGVEKEASKTRGRGIYTIISAKSNVQNSVFTFRTLVFSRRQCSRKTKVHALRETPSYQPWRYASRSVNKTRNMYRISGIFESSRQSCVVAICLSCLQVI
jgi:hypothetical protein